MYVKVRFTFENEADALRVWEELKATSGWHVKKPSQGTNPKYADDQKWLMYCEFEGSKIYSKARELPR